MAKKKKGVVEEGDIHLTVQQRAFVEKRVGELGSVEKVELFYNRNDSVSCYARMVAGKRFT